MNLLFEEVLGKMFEAHPPIVGVTMDGRKLYHFPSHILLTTFNYCNYTLIEINKTQQLHQKNNINDHSIHLLLNYIHVVRTQDQLLPIHHRPLQIVDGKSLHDF